MNSQTSPAKNDIKGNLEAPCIARLRDTISSKNNFMISIVSLPLLLLTIKNFAVFLYVIIENFLTLWISSGWHKQATLSLSQSIIGLIIIATVIWLRDNHPYTLKELNRTVEKKPNIINITVSDNKWLHEWLLKLPELRYSLKDYVNKSKISLNTLVYASLWLNEWNKNNEMQENKKRHNNFLNLVKKEQEKTDAWSKINIDLIRGEH